MQTTRPEVLITRKFPDNVIKPLQEIAVVHQWDKEPYSLMPRVEVLRILGRLSAIINQSELKVDEEILRKGTQLRIVANVAMGFDNLDLKLMAKHGVWASNAPGFFDYPVAEYVIGGIIAVMRRLVEADHFVRDGKWNAFQPGYWDGDSLANKILGIIGMGSIGTPLARLASCLGMKVIYYNRSRSSSEYEWAPFQEVISRADVLSIHVPYSEATHEMIAAAEFAAMKPGVIFVNTSRGKVVNEVDLVHYLRMGHIKGAVLDVFYQEPVVPDELKSMSNVLLTPHLAGGTTSARIGSYQLAVANIVAVLNGKQPVSPLNKI